MKKSKFTSYFLFVSFLTLITIFISIVQKSYFNFRKPQDLVENNSLLKEFNPNLDLSIISIIESKKKNTEENIDLSIIKSNRSDETYNIEPTIEPTVIPVSEANPSSPNETLIEETTL